MIVKGVIEQLLDRKLENDLISELEDGIVEDLKLYYLF